MKLEFGYGNATQCVNVPDSNLIATLRANKMEHENTGEDAVRYALDNPIASDALKNLVQPGQKIAIVTSDVSRPMPSWVVMPLLLDELYSAGIKAQDITVVLALGSHRKHTEEEKKHLVGERCYNEVSVVDSDVARCKHVGTTKNGTPCDFDERVVDADFRICMGNIEFHYFAGYSGGYKALMPGVSTNDAIQANHSLMVSDNAYAGKLEGNPVRIDIDEAGAMLGVDFIVNAVLDEHKNIVYCVAGDVVEAHKQGCKYLDQMYRCQIPKRADIVLVSQGGAPKDANLYQVQKALDNAKHAVAPGGTIICIGACNEGLGSAKFEEWLTGHKSAKDMIAHIQKDFQLGGHKAAAIAMILQNANIDLVSEMNDDFVRSIFLNPQPSAQVAFESAIEKYGDKAAVIAMPYGGSTLPICK